MLHIARCSVFLLVSGCVTTDIFKDISVGHTGCIQSEMEISGVTEGASGFGSTWVVTCQGRRFLCGGFGRDVSCHERLKPSEPAPTTGP
jgi:hypothetical protein